MSDIEKCCCCSDKKTLRTSDDKKKILNRLSRIEGQVRGLKKMVEEDCYCVDILVQSCAVNAAINSFNKDLLGRHIENCVTRDLINGNKETTEELLNIIQKLMK